MCPLLVYTNKRRAVQTRCASDGCLFRAVRRIKPSSLRILTALSIPTLGFTRLSITYLDTVAKRSLLWSTFEYREPSLGRRYFGSNLLSIVTTKHTSPLYQMLHLDALL